MTGGLWRNSALALLAMAVAFPAAAQTAAPAGDAAQGSKNARDPNEIVCEKIEIIGSRLNSKRICATRAQWAEQRLRDRMDIDNRQRIGTKSE